MTNKAEYYILWNGDDVSNYCNPHCSDMEDLKQQICKLKYGESSIEDDEIEIYVKTNLRVKTRRVVEIYEDAQHG